MSEETSLLFVYGTLMQGEVNVAQMAGAVKLGEARTCPGWTLYLLDGYPGMVPGNASQSVEGEVWAVPSEVMERLDVFEGVAEGLYARQVIALADEWSGREVFGYRFLGEVGERGWLGSSWKNR